MGFKGPQNVPKMSTFIVILTKIKYIFLFVTTNTWYDSAKHYRIHQRGHLIDKKNLSMVKWVKYGPLTLGLR